MVLPSEREGLANAWIEALACGTPLVITDVGGAREVVTRRPGGWSARIPTRSLRGPRIARRSAGPGRSRRPCRAVQLGGERRRSSPRTTPDGERVKPRRSRASFSCRSIAVSVGTKLAELTFSQIRIGAAM